MIVESNESKKDHINSILGSVVVGGYENQLGLTYHNETVTVNNVSTVNKVWDKFVIYDRPSNPLFPWSDVEDVKLSSENRELIKGIKKEVTHIDTRLDGIDEIENKLTGILGIKDNQINNDLNVNNVINTHLVERDPTNSSLYVNRLAALSRNFYLDIHGNVYRRKDGFLIGKIAVTGLPPLNKRTFSGLVEVYTEGIFTVLATVVQDYVIVNNVTDIYYRFAFSIVSVLDGVGTIDTKIGYAPQATGHRVAGAFGNAVKVFIARFRHDIEPTHNFGLLVFDLVIPKGSYYYSRDHQFSWQTVWRQWQPNTVNQAYTPLPDVQMPASAGLGFKIVNGAIEEFGSTTKQDLSNSGRNVPMYLTKGYYTVDPSTGVSVRKGTDLIKLSVKTGIGTNTTRGIEWVDMQNFPKIYPKNSFRGIQASSGIDIYEQVDFTDTVNNIVFDFDPANSALATRYADGIDGIAYNNILVLYIKSREIFIYTPLGLGLSTPSFLTTINIAFLTNRGATMSVSGINGDFLGEVGAMTVRRNGSSVSFRMAAMKYTNGLYFPREDYPLVFKGITTLGKNNFTIREGSPLSSIQRLVSRFTVDRGASRGLSVVEFNSKHKVAQYSIGEDSIIYRLGKDGLIDVLSGMDEQVKSIKTGDVGGTASFNYITSAANKGKWENTVITLDLPYNQTARRFLDFRKPIANLNQGVLLIFTRGNNIFQLVATGAELRELFPVASRFSTPTVSGQYHVNDTTTSFLKCDPVKIEFTVNVGGRLIVRSSLAAGIIKIRAIPLKVVTSNGPFGL